MGVDILMLLPQHPADFANSVDPKLRQVMAPRLGKPASDAIQALEEYVGCKLDDDDIEVGPMFDGKPMDATVHRTLASVTLATHLERAGLTWQIVDPGLQDLVYWRKRIESARDAPPKCVAISTTYIWNVKWLHAMCAMIRAALPKAKLLVGGYFYASSVKSFLSLDADVFCVGEGELRLPMMVKALVGGRGLEDIPGLYIRRPDGSLASTGQAEPLPLARLPRVDWKLAERIEPAVDLSKDLVEIGLETQRGCVFKCEFCTFRTLASLNIMPVEDAVDAIFHTASVPRGSIHLYDATATFPRERWRELLQKVIEKGGLPHPMWCYARVSDLHEENVDLMARAGVKAVFIGQETADPGLLSAMRKGTRVDDVMPAMQNLRKYGITAEMAFIHGFPGETKQTLEASRNLLTTINQQWPQHPVVFCVYLSVFSLQDFAAVATRDSLQDSSHLYGYGAEPFSYQAAADAVLETQLRLAHIPHAPVVWFGGVPSFDFCHVSMRPYFYDLFRYSKAVDLGAAIFIEHALEGKPIDDAKLRKVREEIRSRLPMARKLESRASRFVYRMENRFQNRILEEWAREQEHGIGPLTRLKLGRMAYQASGSARSFVRSAIKGEFLPCTMPSEEGQQLELGNIAQNMRGEAVERGRIAKVSKALKLSTISLPVLQPTPEVDATEPHQ